MHASFGFCPADLPAIIWMQFEREMHECREECDQRARAKKGTTRVARDEVPDCGVEMTGPKGQTMTSV